MNQRYPAWRSPRNINPTPTQFVTLVSAPRITDAVAGPHTIEAAPSHSTVHMLDFNGELRSAAHIGKSGIEFSYESSSRALAVVDRKPTRIEIDGADQAAETLAGEKTYTISLPRGQHLVTVEMD